MSKAHQKAVEKYNSINYDRLTFRVKKEDTESIKAAAAAAGLSVNGFIYEAVQEKMQKQAGPPGPVK